jgi:hypothetical protein
MADAIIEANQGESYDEGPEIQAATTEENIDKEVTEAVEEIKEPTIEAIKETTEVVEETKEATTEATEEKEVSEEA